MLSKRLIPFKATHPGILIEDELEVRDNIKQKDLAREMGVKPSFLNEIIKGKRALTADNAIILEKILEIPADYWMRFQSQYEIDNARVKKKNINRLALIEKWGIIKKYVPIKFLKKLNYLTDSINDDIKKILEIYNVSSIEKLITASSDNQNYYRKSDKLQIDKKNMLAWSSIATYEARHQESDKFHLENIDELCIQLNEVFYKNENTIENTSRVLNQFGIKFITVQKLEKTPIDGFSFWSRDNPAIALTLRHNRIDNFAFTIMHELGHIALHLSKNRDATFIEYRQEKQKNKEEREADEFAKTKLISKDSWNKILINNTLDDDKIKMLGALYSINPAILYGRVCYELNHYSHKTEIDKKLK